MRNRYAIALAILGAYFIASYFILHGAIEDQRSMQRTIGVSGQQRMYSQRIAMFADALAAGPGHAGRHRADEDLHRSIAIFGEVHRALTLGDPKINPKGWPPPRIRSIYFGGPQSVDRQVRAYIAHARAFEARANRQAIRADDRDLAFLLSVGPGPLLNSLDAVVGAYVSEQRTSVAKFEFLQVALLILGLSTLVLVWFTILIPMEREILRRTTAMELSAAQDSLTGTFNRKAFSERVVLALRESHDGVERAMLMIDIDNFKTINDTFGHSAGDDTIVRISNIIRASVRESDYAARFGGDEFAIFIGRIESDASLHAFVERLCNALQYDFASCDIVHRVTVSIGVARFPRDAISFDALIDAADSALYASKRAGRARHAFFVRDSDGRDLHQRGIATSSSTVRIG